MKSTTKVTAVFTDKDGIERGLTLTADRDTPTDWLAQKVIGLLPKNGILSRVEIER